MSVDEYQNFLKLHHSNDDRCRLLVQSMCFHTSVSHGITLDAHKQYRMVWIWFLVKSNDKVPNKTMQMRFLVAIICQHWQNWNKHTYTNAYRVIFRRLVVVNFTCYSYWEFEQIQNSNQLFIADKMQFFDWKFGPSSSQDDAIHIAD